MSIYSYNTNSHNSVYYSVLIVKVNSTLDIIICLPLHMSKVSVNSSGVSESLSLVRGRGHWLPIGRCVRFMLYSECISTMNISVMTS